MYFNTELDSLMAFAVIVYRCKASSRGLVVKADLTTERSWLQTLTIEAIFHALFIWIRAWKQKLSGN